MNNQLWTSAWGWIDTRIRPFLLTMPDNNFGGSGGKFGKSWNVAKKLRNDNK